MNNLPIESGTWTPVLYYDSQTSALQYTRAYAYYYKVGSLVFMTMRVNVTSIGSGARLRIRNKDLPYLPYQVSSPATGNLLNAGKMYAVGTSVNYDYLFITGATTGDVGSSDITTGVIMMSIMYLTGI